MADETKDGAGREKIARTILIFSAGGLVFLAVAVMVASAIGVAAGPSKDTKDLLETGKYLFNTLLPLLGTWVGTVLAYYFSKENFESANKSMKDMVQVTLEQRLAKLKVAEKMIRSEQAAVVVVPAGKTDKDIPLEELRKKLDQRVTRLPVLDDKKALKYMVHQSLIFKVMADRLLLVQQGAPGPFADLTLADLVATPDMRAQVTALAYVGAEATVADAKTKMDETAGCQDVIVTKTGAPTEPMLGWLPNVEIGRLSKA